MDFIEEHKNTCKRNITTFSSKLEERTLLFAIKTIILSALLPETTKSKVIKNQLTKAGTSIGANYREANRARTKAGFRNKIKNCERESCETEYLSTAIKLMDWTNNEEIQPCINKEIEYLAHFTTIAKNTSSQHRSGI